MKGRKDSSQRSSGGWLQFRLRTLLIWVTIAAVLTWYVQTRRTIASIQRQLANCEEVFVHYDWQDDGLKAPAAPKWLRDIIGDDFFQEIVAVEIGGSCGILISITPVIGARADDNYFSGAAPPQSNIPKGTVSDATPAWAAVERKRANELQQVIDLISRLPSIRRLNLEFGYSPIDDAVIGKLSKLKNLRELVLDRTAITGEGLRHLRGLRLLTRLSLRGTRIGDAALYDVSRLPNLKDLDLSETDIHGWRMSYFGSMCNLEKLRLSALDLTAYYESGAWRDEQGLMHLGKLHKLRELDLSGLDVSIDADGEPLGFLASLSNLEVLDLASVENCSFGFGHLKELNRLKSLNLRDTNTMDEDLLRLPKLQALVELDLSGNDRITDQGLQDLAVLPQLQRLNLYYTSVSRAGIEALKRCNPRVIVEGSFPDEPENKGDELTDPFG